MQRSREGDGDRAASSPRRPREAETFLRTITAELLESVDPSAAFRRVVERVAEFLDLGLCTFDEIDAAHRVARPQAFFARDLGRPPVEFPIGMKALEGIFEGHTLLVADTLRDPRTRHDREAIYHREGARAFVAVPRMRGGRCEAALVAASTRPRRWRAWEVQLLEGVADRLWLCLDRFRQQLDLQRRLAVLATYYENAPVGLAFIDRDRRFVRVNEMLAGINGLPAAAHVGKRIAEVVPEVWPTIEPLYRRVLDDGETIREVDIEAPDRRPGGMSIRLSVFPVRDASGRVMGAGAVVSDVTERRRTEERLHQTSEIVRAIADNVPDLVYAKDRHHRLILANPATLAVIGRTAEQALGRTDEEWADDPAQGRVFMETDARIMRSGHGERIEEVFGPGGGRVYQSVKVPLRIRGEVVGVVGVTRDVTVEKERERALEELVRARTAELERSVASLEELLYTIAHDLRAPNRAMNGYAALLLAEYGAALTEEARGYLGRIRAASVRNDQLIHDLLAYGRLAHAAVRPEPVDVAPLVEEVRAKLGPDVEARRGQVSVAPELPCMLASAEFLKEILHQLLENAVRHGGAPPIVRVEGEETGATAVVRVIDAGPGIPEDQQERVFDPFTRLPATTDVTGTGMGLAIVRRAVERMKGRVGVVSHPGGGSCFWFELPSGHRGGGDARVVRG